jgi:hypothetical protein
MLASANDCKNELTRVLENASHMNDNAIAMLERAITQGQVCSVSKSDYRYKYAVKMLAACKRTQGVAALHYSTHQALLNSKAATAGK